MRRTLPLLLALGLVAPLVAEKPPGTGEYRRGVAHLKGKGAEKDARKAAKWIHKAARKGHAQARYLLGKLYWKGHGVGKNPARARAWLGKAAGQGHAKARKLLAKISTAAAANTPLEKPPAPDLGLVGSASAAITPEEEASAADVRGRMNMLMKSYTPEMRAGIRQRAESGVAFDLFQMGFMHETGQGEPKDREKAKGFYERSRDKGYTLARVFLRDLGAGAK